MQPLSTPLLQLLKEQLLAARAYNAEALARKQEGKIIEVPGIGQNIASAYEQLRRAAESAEEQLLLQRAIRRFYRRSIAFSSNKEPSGVGSELILDLTHAGYLANQSVSAQTAKPSPDSLNSTSKSIRIWAGCGCRETSGSTGCWIFCQLKPKQYCIRATSARRWRMWRTGTLWSCSRAKNWSPRQRKTRIMNSACTLLCTRRYSNPTLRLCDTT